MKSFSQCAQDIFVISLLKNPGTFLDLGCNLPKHINNTYLLEENGWTGVSVDIKDYSKEWEVRKNKFIKADCFNIDYSIFLQENYTEKIIDYLSLDMEIVGERYRLAEKVLTSGFKFKIITIEHDSHLGQDFIEKEKNPQRKLLSELGYKLICSDVSQKQFPESFYEDWWINPDYFQESITSNWICDKLSCDKIFDKMGISYEVDDISKKWW
jgi:hypothetical protein